MISLNGPFGLELGTADDVLNWDSKFPITVSLTDQADKSHTWKFFADGEGDLYLAFERPAEVLYAFSNGARHFTYLSAERLGPRAHFRASSVPADEVEVGVHGERSAHVLDVLGDRPRPFEDRAHPEADADQPPLLKYDVERWLAEIARRTEIFATRYPGSSLTQLKFKSGADAVTAPNMGFGLTYVLPIILGGLLAGRGSFFIVENPEAHLHPRGQSRIGMFLAWLASKGVQVLIETHSDHVINGIRLAIADRQYLPSNKAVLHFFGAEDDVPGAKTSESLLFRDDGSISHWPKGFFDQYQLDVASLGRVRRRR